MNRNLLIVLAFLLFNIGYGQQLKTWTGAVSTSWDDNDNWDGLEKPIASDNVLITNVANQPIINNIGASCAKLELRNSTPGSMVVLTIKSGGSFSPASIVMNSFGDTSNCSLNINNAGEVTVSGDIIMNGNALQNDVTFSGDGFLLIGGTMTGGVLNADGKGTVSYNGVGTHKVGAYSYNNLTLSGTGVRTITSGVIVNGKLNMAGTATASAAPTYGTDAGLKYSVASFTAGPEWVSPFTAKAGVEIATPGLMISSVVTMGSTVADKKFSDGVKLIVNKDASLIFGNTDLYLGGDFINNNGSLTTDGFVYLTGNVSQSIASFISTKGVAMNKGAGTATITGNINTKKLIINGLGTLSLGSGLTHSFTDWERIQGTLNGRSSILKISGNVIGAGGTFMPGTSTVEFNGGAQNLGTGSITYNNLVLSGSGIKTFGAVTTINDTFSIVDGVKADLTANLVHTAKSIKLGTTTGSGGSWGSSLSNAVNKNNTFFVTNNGIVNVGPTIVISTDSLLGLTTTYGKPSDSKSFDLSGLAMLEGILVSAPAGFEVSTDGTTFSDALTIGAAGAIASKTVFVRLKGTIDAKDYSGNIVLTSNGTTTINVAIANSTVNKAPLTITAKDNGKVYGSDNPPLTVSYVGFVNGETETVLTTQVATATTAVKTSPVGNYPITVSGAVASNYTITYGANAVFSITRAALTITANSNGKVYGSDNPVLTATYAGFVNGDTAASLTTQATIATTAVKGSAVGDYPITVSGAVSPNYTITYGTNGKLSVTPAALTITADNNSKAYGSDNPVLTATYAGFVNGDTATNLTTQATIATTAVKGSAVGDYPITVSGAASPNYTIIYGTNGKLSVTPAALTITADNNSKAYGSDNPVLTATYVGFVNGDTAASLTTQAAIATTAVKGSVVGDYPITVSGAASPNYTINYGTNGKLSVTRAALTITADNNSKVYGSDNPVLTVTYAGFVNGDTAASLTTQATIATTAVKGSVVGDYPITVSGAASSNYTITYGANGKLSVTRAALIITADNNSKVYGSDNPVLTVTYAGFVNGDTAASLTTQATIATTAVKGSVVGDYPITVSGAASSNYTITYGPNASFKITPADLIIKVINTSKIRGSENPAFAVEYDKFVNGDTETKLNIQPIFTTEVNKDSKKGKYEVTVKVANLTNYNINYIAGILEVLASSNADLADIVISKGDLDKPVKDNNKFHVEVPNETSSFVINPIPVDPYAKAEVVVDGKTIDPTVPIDLKVGDNEIKIVVTAEDGTQKEYTVVVTRELSNNSGLTDLAISKGELSPAFAEGTTEYTATVKNDVTSINVTPTIADPTAIIKVEGEIVASGDASQEIPLKVGKNEITTEVTAQDGTTTTYTVIVTREPSNNADLADIVISKGDLDQPVKDNNKFHVEVPNETSSFVINPIPVDPNAKVVVIVDGKTIDPTAPIDFKIGDNEIKIVVTAEDGVTQKEYTVIVTREDVAPSDNAGLADIVISDGTLSPTFNTDTHEYKVEVPNETDTFIINPLPIDPNANVVVTVDGKTIDPAAPIDLNVGENVITIVVTAEDGTTIETYTVIVDRAKAEIVPTNIITPNGDGKNDFWIIPGIESYPNNSVKVFDRAARLMYSGNNYNNDWDGTYKGSPLTEDTYYYLIDLGNGSPKLKGFITIIRN